MAWLNELLLPENAKQLLKEAQQLIELKNYDSALLKLQLAITYRRHFPEFHSLMALCYIRKGMYTSAMYSLKDALELDSDHQEAHYYQGLVQSALKNTSEAIESFRKAIQLGYQNASVYNDLGLAYFQKKENDKAISQYNIAVNKNPDFFTAYKNLADCYLAQNKYQEATEAAKKALITNPKYVEAYLILGEAYLKSGDSASAVKSFNNALNLEPDNKNIIQRLAGANVKTGNYQEAYHYYERLSILQPDNPEIYSEMADCSYYAANIEQAVAGFKKALELAGPSAKILHGLGKSYLAESQQQDLDEAEKHLKSALNFASQNAAILADLGLCCLNKKEGQKALGYFEQALKLNNGQPAVYEITKNIAKTYLELQDYQKAAEYLKKALKENPANKEEINHLMEQAEQFMHSLSTEMGGPVEDVHQLSKTQNLTINLYNKLQLHKSFNPFIVKVAGLIAEFDKPLIVTVMGEFKVGKSTFINALVGKEIAPMGVTPTTATINYFQYGSRSKIRINWSDGSEPDNVRIDKLAEYVDERKVNKQEIENIKLVEIFHDLELLRDINIVDTPGLNAGISRHEATTINFIEKADAIIWLFDVEQAGKASEKKIFNHISKFAKKTIAVVNGIDKVEPEEVDEVTKYIKQQFPENFSEIIGVSARNALKGKINETTDLLEKSGFQQLEEFLNKHIYQQSYQIKNQSLRAKLNFIIKDIEMLIVDFKQSYNQILTEIELFRNEIGMARQQLNDFMLNQEIILKDGLNDLYNQAGKEASEFINPTRGLFEGVFGTNKFTAEDKKFLLKLIEKSLKQLLDNVRVKQEEKASQLNHNFTDIFKKLADIYNHETDYQSVFAIYHNEKVRELYSKVILPNYRYYQGYLDAGILDKFFDELGHLTDLSANNLAYILRKYLPDIIPVIKACLNEWSGEYCLFLNNLSHTIEKNIRNSHIDLDQDILRPIEKIIIDIDHKESNCRSE